MCVRVHVYVCVPHITVTYYLHSVAGVSGNTQHLGTEFVVYSDAMATVPDGCVH